MEGFNWGKLVNQFEIRTNSSGYTSALSFREYCERAKQLASEKYEKITIIGNGNKETKRLSQTDAIGFIGCESYTEQVVILAGSLIRNIEDYKCMHEVYEFSASNRFNQATLNKREEIEKETIKITIDDKQYTMILKDTPCKSLNVASVITYLSHNDHRRRYECDLSTYRYGSTKFELKTKRLEGLNLRVRNKCIGKIRGSYIISDGTHEIKPIDNYLKYRNELMCGIYPFDFIYKEID